MHAIVPLALVHTEIPHQNVAQGANSASPATVEPSPLNLAPLDLVDPSLRLHAGTTGTDASISEADTVRASHVITSNGKATSAAAPMTPHERISAAIRSSDVLELAAIVEEATTLEAKRALLEKKDDAGLTPLLIAVSSKKPAAAAMLAYLGADLLATTRAGLTAPFLAAHASENMVRLFLDGARFAGKLHDGLHVSPSGMRKLLDYLISKSPSVGTERLDAFAARFTGADVRHFNDAGHLQKYISHVQELDDNPLGVRANGWELEQFLPLRIRSLLSIAVDPGMRARIDPDDNRALSILANEMAGELEALRFRNRNLAVGNIKNDMLRAGLAQLEAQSIVARLKVMPDDFEYSMPGGWAGHALYVGISTRIVQGQRVMSLRVDNRGAGKIRHENDHKTFIYPYIVNMPLAALQDKQSVELFEDMVTALMLRKVTPASLFVARLYYNKLDLFRAHLIAQYGPAAVEDGPRTFVPQPKQTTGNCVVANHDAGLSNRLGQETADAIREMETQMATTRLFEVLQPSVLQARIAENKIRIAKKLKIPSLKLKTK